MKRRTKLATARAQKKAAKDATMDRPSGLSRYGKKNRVAERSRGYSRRKESPFFMSPAAVRLAREDAARAPQVQA